jgi:hypothetical protein
LNQLFYSFSPFELSGINALIPLSFCAILFLQFIKRAKDQISTSNGLHYCLAPELGFEEIVFIKQ